MTNSAKTPTGKTSKGKVSVYVEKGRIKVRLPRQYFGGEQKRIGLGMDATDENMARAQLIAQRMEWDLRDSCFDVTLVKYGIVAELEIKKGATTATTSDQSPPKPELSLLEVWDMYCEYRKHDLKETMYEMTYKKLFPNYLKSAIEATKSEEPLKIRNWLVENRNLKTVKDLLSNLSKAYQLGMKNKLLTHNPYDGMAEEIKVKGAKGKTQDEVNTESDNDLLDKTKAYTWDEVQAILEYIENNSRIKHWYPFVKFKFITGCRTGEAIAFMWCDVKWDSKEILIRRTYNGQTKKFYPTKTAIGDKELIRRFPMPKDGELWNLLKSIPQGELTDVVFKSKTGKIIDDGNFRFVWQGRESHRLKGIISELIKQGKLVKYLSPYNTRHTFITHQIFDLGRDEKIVSAWCGHGELVSQKHYQDIADRATQINPELPANQQVSQQVDNQQSRIEMLEVQNRELMEAMRKQQELIERLLAERDKQG